MANEPVYDMDGCYYHAEPSDADLVAYEAEQRQAAEWNAAGLCENCGGSGPLVCGGICGGCMDDYCRAMAGGQG